MSRTSVPSEPEKDSKEATVARAELERLRRIEQAARALDAVWSPSGFYNEQDPALALALHEALEL